MNNGFAQPAMSQFGAYRRPGEYSRAYQGMGQGIGQTGQGIEDMLKAMSDIGKMGGQEQVPEMGGRAEELFQSDDLSKLNLGTA